jgi:5S rRNA maturation endonuclease (ribonuclease M5)
MAGQQDTARQRRFLQLNNQEVDLTELYFKSAPSGVEMYHVGDPVEVFCDHDKSGNRIRDWLTGTVVQVDSKMIAVQFQENVYLTDGWMVPDHVLWCPKNSTNIRVARKRKRPRVRVK